jgi:hypothetical protein
MDAKRIQAIIDGIPDAKQLADLAAGGDFKAAVIALVELAATASAFLRIHLETQLAEALATEALQAAPKPAGR